MFHGLSPLEFHGVVGESLEPCFAGIEPHAPVAPFNLHEHQLVVRPPWSATVGRGSRLAALESLWVKGSFKLF